MKYALMFVVVIAAGCNKKKESASSPPPNAGSAAVTPATGSATEAAQGTAGTGGSAASGSAAAATPAHDGDDLFSLASGVIVIDGPGGGEGHTAPFAMLDEDPTTGFAQDSEKVTPKPIVLALPDRVQIDTVVLDDAKTDLDTRLAKEILVEVSDKSATGPWQPIVKAEPQMPPADDVQFAATAKVPARWVRISIKGCHCDAQTSTEQVMELRAYGTRLERGAPINVTGSYKTDQGYFYLTQTGTSVTGCYEQGTAPFAGGIEGNVVKFEWVGATPNDRGPGLLIVGSDRVFGGHWPMKTDTNEHPMLEPFEGTKTSSKPGPCPKPVDPIAAALKATGRVRLYGINFDTDSATLRSESKPVLDHVVEILKADPSLKLRIEGHTDSTSTPEHNQTLSEQRAASVKDYLVKAGIDGARLEPKGFGDTLPIAPNSTGLGRAANRRVELAKP
jgi:OOP family OmpA-OmpF porin